jgi:hypothetical protein
MLKINVAVKIKELSVNKSEEIFGTAEIIATNKIHGENFMQTFNLKEAAIFLKKSTEATRRAAANGKIPAAKVGQRWIFLLDDLVEFLRSRYATPAETSWGVIDKDRRKIWRSTNEMTSGGSLFVEKDIAYRKAVGLPIK